MTQLEMNISNNRLNFMLNDGDSCYIAITDTLIQDWEYCINTYENAKQNSQDSVLLSLGQSLFNSIYNEQSRVVLDLWLQPNNPRSLSIIASSQPCSHEQHLLSLPWELLTNPTSNDFLARDSRCLFEVIRRIGQPNPNPPELKYKDLILTFMSADPNQAGELNYEAEEWAIYSATKNIDNLTLVVNETGNLKLLSDQLYEDIGDCDILHLSCHGGRDDNGFFLHMEDEGFGTQKVSARDFQDLQSQINTLFLSACHSAGFVDVESSEIKSSTNIQQKQCMMIDMVVMGIVNVIGWDGSVGDADATKFAHHFYQSLQRGNNITSACAIARRELLGHNFADWHLARSYCGADGNHPLIDRRKPKHQLRKIKSCYKKLDEIKAEMPVASKETFVGRKRQIKQSLLTLKDDQYAGLLFYGIGGTGKSSLTARILDRLEPTFQSIIVYKDYSEVAVLKAFEAAFKRINRSVNFDEYIQRIYSNPNSLYDILFEWLEDDFNESPIALVVDDLEQEVLDAVNAATDCIWVKPEYRNVMTSIIKAFNDAETKSCLIMTSRYQFELMDNETNIAKRLYAVEVPDMKISESIRHWLALQRTTEAGAYRPEQDDETLISEIIKTAKGNAGLQTVLFMPLLNNEREALKQALAQVQSHRANYKIDNPDSKLGKYLTRIALEVYVDALTSQEKSLLQVLTLFDFAIPVAVLKHTEIGINDMVNAMRRLDSFGLLMYDDSNQNDSHVSCYGLVNNIIDPLSTTDRDTLAKQFAPMLWQYWFKEFRHSYVDGAKDIDSEPLTIEVLKNELGQFESCDEYIRKHIEVELQSNIAAQLRIGYLNRLCIINSLIDWELTNVTPRIFLSLLELSLSLNIIVKLTVSVSALSGLSILQGSRLAETI